MAVVIIGWLVEASVKSRTCLIMALWRFAVARVQTACLGGHKTQPETLILLLHAELLAGLRAD